MGYQLISLVFIVLLNKFLHGVPLQELYEGSNCKLEDGKPGICKKIHDCPFRLREVQEGRRTADSKGRCGFDKNTEIVCCNLTFNISGKLDEEGASAEHRPAEMACQYYENEINKARLQVEYQIYDGTAAKPGEFPYMVALGYVNPDKDDINSEDIKYKCGGTLISSQHVLTAAHCVYNADGNEPVEIRIGNENLKDNKNVQRINISNVTRHPRYKRNINYDDVAILKLAAPVSLENNVRPICISTESLTSMDKTENISFVVVGWGATDIDEDFSNKLMKTANLSLVDRETCAKSFTGFGSLPNGLDENMLCMLDTNVTRRSDACQGDSGGPLLMMRGPNHSIVGITSFGQNCGGPVPGVYMAVYSYLEWIENHVWPEISREQQITGPIRVSRPCADCQFADIRPLARIGS